MDFLSVFWKVEIYCVLKSQKKKHLNRRHFCDNCYTMLHQKGSNQSMYVFLIYLGVTHCILCLMISWFCCQHQHSAFLQSFKRLPLKYIRLYMRATHFLYSADARNFWLSHFSPNWEENTIENATEKCRKRPTIDPLALLLNTIKTVN